MYMVPSPRPDGLNGILSVLTFGLVGGGKKFSESEARSAVQQIYLELLGREPDYPAAQGYVDCAREGKNCPTLSGGKKIPPDERIVDIRTHILRSPERADFQRRQLSAEMTEFTSTAGGDTSALASPGSFSFAEIPSEVGGIPIAYFVGGFALLLLLKKR